MSPTYRAAGRSVLKVYAHPGEAAFVADIMLTPSGAEFAAHSLNIGASHIEPHRTLGARVQPGAPREVIEQRARELGEVIERHQVIDGTRVVPIDNPRLAARMRNRRDALTRRSGTES